MVLLQPKYSAKHEQVCSGSLAFSRNKKKTKKFKKIQMLDGYQMCLIAIRLVARCLMLDKRKS